MARGLELTENHDGCETLSRTSSVVVIGLFRYDLDVVTDAEHLLRSDQILAARTISHNLQCMCYFTLFHRGFVNLNGFVCAGDARVRDAET